jgi:predicted ATPase
LCDNLEHLLPDAAGFLGTLISAAPSLRLVATSREPLHIQGETEFDLPPLDEAEAVGLFCERARAVRPDVEESDAVRLLCARLDRLPLALELAAARTKILAPDALLARLGDSLDLLRGARDADDRHTTLRTTISWSYELLDADEQRLFQRLAVFRGGCTLESAEDVCGAELGTLASLLDKSLIRRRDGRLGEERFWMLETIREFAAEELEASGEVEAIRRRHAERMLAIADSAHLSEDDDEPFELELAFAEREDLRAALDWAVAWDLELAARLAVSLETFWNAHANDEGRQRLQAIVTQATALEPGLLSKALRVAGNTMYNVDENASRTHWERSLELCRELGDDRGAALVLHRMALIPLENGDIEQSRRMVDQSQRLSAGRSQLIEAVNLWMYAQFAFEDGRIEAAISLSRESAERADAIGWAWWVSGQRTYLAKLALAIGDLDGAEREARAGLVIAREHENRLRAALAISTLAQAAVARGAVERAGVMWGAAEAEVRRTPIRDPVEWFGGDLVTTSDPSFSAAVDRGRRLTLWDGAAVALGELEPPQTVS